MAYDEGLAQRIRAVLDELQPPGRAEKKMFGGVGFMVQGNMACGVHQDRLIVRVRPEEYPAALAKPHATPFDMMTGRPIAGWVMVAPAGCESPAALESWVREGVAFALTLPAKR